MPHLPHIIKGKHGERRGFEETNKFGPSANSHSGSKDGSQAEPKSRVEVDLKVCGIQAVKSTVINFTFLPHQSDLPTTPSSQGGLRDYNSTSCVFA